MHRLFFSDSSECVSGAFFIRADGVYVAGCLEGECHYRTGNLRAKKRVAYVKKVLAEIGMAPDRVAMYNLSSAQGKRFAEITDEITARIRELGPSPVNKPTHRDRNHNH
ncbi:MAG: hydrogenase iron-sulfur subunit [Desulfobacteraceae bacterium]|nr:hydrogenase iron-sulfur subunit [Desulfobacteraceae bacterium]